MVSYFGLRVKDIDYLNPDDVSKKLVSLNLLTTDWLNILLQSRLDWFITNIARSSTFSVASIGTHWTGGKNAYIPKTRECQESLLLLDKTISIIKDLNPK